MSNEFYALNREAIINQCVADKEAEMAAEAANAMPRPKRWRTAATR